MQKQNFSFKKYIAVFFITFLLFVTAIYLSNFFGDKKVAELRNIQDKISMDILSSETQYALLSELSCKNVTNSVLSDELNSLGAKLEWSENNLGNTQEVAYLKKYYSLLEIKDYLLMKKIADRCKQHYAFILYFYTNAENCTECKREGAVLSRLKEEYPELRVYSFDFSTELSAVETMLKIFKIEDTKLPALVLDDEVLTGFHSLEELQNKIETEFKLESKETSTQGE